MDKDDPICFYKAPVHEFTSEKEDESAKNGPHMQWVSFLPDATVDKVKEAHNAGIFSFRMEFHDVSKLGEFQMKKV